MDRNILANITASLKRSLRRLSFRSGVIVLFLCIPFYLLSFLQMLLPIDIAAKGALWIVFFGLAKTFQYAGLTIVGAEGIRGIRARFRSAGRK